MTTIIAALTWLTSRRKLQSIHQSTVRWHYQHESEQGARAEVWRYHSRGRVRSPSLSAWCRSRESRCAYADGSSYKQRLEQAFFHRQHVFHVLAYVRPVIAPKYTVRIVFLSYKHAILFYALTPYIQQCQTGKVKSLPHPIVCNYQGRATLNNSSDYTTAAESRSAMEWGLRWRRLSHVFLCILLIYFVLSTSLQKSANPQEQRGNRVEDALAGLESLAPRTNDVLSDSHAFDNEGGGLNSSTPAERSLTPKFQYPDIKQYDAAYCKGWQLLNYVKTPEASDSASTKFDSWTAMATWGWTQDGGKIEEDMSQNAGVKELVESNMGTGCS